MSCFAAAPMQAQEIQEFAIGITGGENAQDRLTNNQCYADAISEALGVPVKVYTPADYDGVIQGLLGGTLDMAWLGASAYGKIYLTDPEAVEPKLTIQHLDGATGYYSIAIARADSGIRSLADMKGQIIGFGDPNSTSGYLIPVVEMMENGISTEPGKFFSDVRFTGGHEQTIISVLNGDIKAGVTNGSGVGEWEDGYSSGRIRQAADSGLVNMNDIVEIWKSKLIPEGPMVVRSALPEDVKEKVTRLTDTLWQDDPECAYGVAFGAVQDFVPVEHKAFESIIKARQALAE